jgi:hypothetical protein
MSFDQMSFDQMSFDQMSFDQMSFDQMSFDLMSFYQIVMLARSLHTYRTIAVLTCSILFRRRHYFCFKLIKFRFLNCSENEI